MVVLGSLSPAFGQDSEFERQPLRIGYLLSGSDSLSAAQQSALRGANLGAQEASRAADLLDQQFDVITDTAGGEKAVRQTARQMIEADSVFALAGGSEAETCETLREVAARQDVLFINTGCTDDELRGQRCHRNTFHVAASATMHRDARSEESTTVLWHPSLFRYGAGQLNERFEESFEESMDGPAWRSWIAIKMLWESAQQVQSTDVSQLIQYLESKNARFDGHKGRSLTFRPWNHQLRQPMYRLQTGERTSEDVEQVPGASNEEEISSRTLLDQIGLGKEETACRFEPIPD